MSFCSQSQLATNSTALAASKEEIKKLELQLKKVQTEADSTVNGLQKQHTSVVKKLEEKVHVYTNAMLPNNIHALNMHVAFLFQIEILRQELTDLQAKHEAETGSSHVSRFIS